MLQQLAEAAALNNRYVKAYEAYLLRGLGLLPAENGTAETKDYYVALEETMSLNRVVLLRQVAMQRVARILKQKKSLMVWFEPLISLSRLTSAMLFFTIY